MVCSYAVITNPLWHRYFGLCFSATSNLASRLRPSFCMGKQSPKNIPARLQGDPQLTPLARSERRPVVLRDLSSGLHHDRPVRTFSVLSLRDDGRHCPRRHMYLSRLQDLCLSQTSQPIRALARPSSWCRDVDLHSLGNTT